MLLSEIYVSFEIPSFFDDSVCDAAIEELEDLDLRLKIQRLIEESVKNTRYLKSFPFTVDYSGD